MLLQYKDEEELTPRVALKLQLPKLTISNFRIRNTPLTWLESDKIPVEMTATNTGFLGTKNILTRLGKLKKKV